MALAGVNVISAVQRSRHNVDEQAGFRSMNLDRSVSTLPGVGPKRRESLQQAGVLTVLDLLLRTPRRYSDHRSCVSLRTNDLVAALQDGPCEIAVEGRLQGVRRIFTRRRGMNLVHGKLVTPEGTLRCIWFNRPYLAHTNEEDKMVLLCGQLRRGRNGLEIINAEISDASKPKGLVCHYAPLAGLGGKTLRRLMLAALGEVGSLNRSPDPIPERYLQKRDLPRLGVALEAVHRPSSDAVFSEFQTGASRGHQRLIYGDLMEMQKKLAEATQARRGRQKRHRYQVNESVRSAARSCLPFRLTGAQRRSVKEVIDDMRSRRPMMRLLQGDVGCGKTIVGAMAALVAAESSLQVAVLSPTEVLAEQMALELRRTFGSRHGVGLLTGSSDDRSAVLENLANGTLPIVSGTHALIQDAVVFQQLALVIIDEQHRFGVDQRTAMINKGHAPDVLLMTATPIPRSLALAVFGDLDISCIDELPPGRQGVATKLMADTERQRAADAVEKAVTEGGRVFVVFPRIDDTEGTRVSLDQHAALYERCAPGRVARLTGRTSPEDRSRLIRSFRDGEVSVLLATTVVEVGIDVPEATLIVIEGAEHFGLSQLHQLRGRVGRNRELGHCLALHGVDCQEETMDRLRSFASIQDGFELAEMDLRTRGPGNLLGIEQSGFSHWTAGRLANAVEWLEAAREDATDWVRRASGSVGEGVADPSETGQKDRSVPRETAF